MKKYIILIAIMLACALLTGCGIIANGNVISSTASNTLEISGKPIENGYNSYLSGGQLCQLGDIIYYLDEKNNSTTLMEITKTGSEKRYEFGDQSYAKSENIRLYVNSGKLFCLDLAKHIIYLFDFKTNTLKQVCDCKKYITAEEFYLNNDTYYYLNDKYSLVIEKGNKSEIIERDICNLYITEQNIYYTKILKLKLVFYEYNKTSKQKKEILSIEYGGTCTDVYGFFVENGNLIYYHYNQFEPSSIYKYKIGSIEKPTLIHTNEKENGSFHVSNVYKDHVYMTADHGITRIDITNNTKKEIESNHIVYNYGVYILDDKWVYYSTDQGGLYRVLQTGSTPELVYQSDR